MFYIFVIAVCILTAAANALIVAYLNKDTQDEETRKITASLGVIFTFMVVAILAFASFLFSMGS